MKVLENIKKLADVKAEFALPKNKNIGNKTYLTIDDNNGWLVIRSGDNEIVLDIENIEKLNLILKEYYTIDTK